MSQAIDGSITRAGVRIRYLRRGPRRGPTRLLLHGLTANTNCFDGLLCAGLDAVDTVAIDLRGRGQSDQPRSGYAIGDHAADVIAVLDALDLPRAMVCGHSYGGLLSVYLAARHPQRVERLVVIDIAGPSVHNPAVLELIAPSLARLGTEWPSREAFLEAMRASPALGGYWDRDLAAYYGADVRALPGGRVRVRTAPETIAQVISEGQKEDWAALLAAVRAPSLLIHARGPFGPPGTPPIVLDDQARATVAELSGCRYEVVPGNHMTMLFGDGALAVAGAILAFTQAD